MNMSVKRNRSFFSSRISLMALGLSVLTACGGGQGGMKWVTTSLLCNRLQ